MLFDSRRQGNLNLVWTNRYTGTLLTFINTWVLCSVLTVNGHDILTTYYLKASKQVCVLRKLKFIIKQEILEKIDLTFIRPLLEYSCEVRDNCSQTDNDRLEKLQLEAARTMYCYWVNCIFEQGFFISRNRMGKIVQQTGTQEAMFNVQHVPWTCSILSV